MTHTNVPTPAGLLDLVGAPLGVTTWHEITQQRVNLFADATDDHQWIHTDPARAAAGPFGTTIAHGYLTLALAPLLIAEAVSVDNVAAVLNYGLKKVRFPAPVPSGSKIRATAEVVEVEEVGGGWFQIVTRFKIEVEGNDKPACVADSVGRALPE